MWMIFGIGAVVSGLLNLYFYFQKRDPKILRFISLSFTALTIWAFYSSANAWVVSGDYSALQDVLPTTTNALLILTLMSVFINGFTLKDNFQRKF